MKSLCVIYGPVDTFSGYGSRSRDIAKAIIEEKKDEWDIKIIPCRWGETPNGFIEDNPNWGFLNQYLYQHPQLPKQPEIMIWVTVPNEFQPLGKYNIGITAGIESTIAPAEWIQGINRMDLTLVSSNHSKNVFLNSNFEQRNKQTNIVEQIIKVEKPIEVLFEGVSLDTYFPAQTERDDLEIDFKLSKVPEKFLYLFSGMWLPGVLSEDRKNVGLLVKAFFETFKNKSDKPGLVLKTSHLGSSYVDREEILKKINQIRKTVNSEDLPNIYLLHGEFSDDEINNLYNHPKIKAMISLTKGEGFGRPLLEFSLSKKPIITTAWSGHLDFLDKEYTMLLSGRLSNIHPSAANHMLLKEAQWFSVDLASVGFSLIDVYKNYPKYLEKAKRQAFKNKTNFSFEKMKEVLIFILNKNIPKFPEQIQLKLPQLKKIELPKLSRINE